MSVPQNHTPADLALHNNFVSSITSLKRSLVRSIHYLRVIYDRKIYRLMGYSSISAYAEQTVGLSRNQTEAFLALGKKLENYPEVKAALGRGELSWSKARVIVGKADSADEKEWIEIARKVSTSDLHAMPIGGAAAPRHEEVKPPGGKRLAREPSLKKRPPLADPAPILPADEICYVTYKFTAEEYSRWSAMLEGLRKQGLNDSKERLALDGLAGLSDTEGSGTGGPGYLLHIHQCPRCTQSVLRNSRGSFEVEPALLEAAACDAVVESEDGSRRASIPPRLRRQVLARDEHHCQGRGCGHTQFLEIHHRLPVAQGGKTELGNLVTLCSGCHRALHRREEELRAVNRDPVR